MARPKSQVQGEQFTIKCSPELLADLQDLARLSRSDVSSIVRNLCSKLVEANRTRIEDFRKQAAVPILFPVGNSHEPLVPMSNDKLDEGANQHED